MAEQTVDLLSQVNRPADEVNMTDLEKKHLPVIDVPASIKADEAFDVTVEVGKLLAHPNEPGHHIEFVDLYEDRVFLCRADLTGGKVYPKVTFSIQLRTGGTLRAFASCNLHGVWEGNTQVSL